MYTDLEGKEMVLDCYDEILGKVSILYECGSLWLMDFVKGTSVEAVTEFYSTYRFQSRTQDNLSSIRIILFCYERDGKLPTWIDDERRW